MPSHPGCKWTENIADAVTHGLGAGKVCSLAQVGPATALQKSAAADWCG
jgi:hypothetical protein